MQGSKWKMIRATNLFQESFPYQTTNPWPFPNHYVDWAIAVYDLEFWLEQYVGHQMVQWAWTGGQCKLAFAKERDRTLFLLRWG